MKNSTETIRALALSKRDQAFATLKSNKDDLLRIYEEGPSLQNDIFIIRSCVGFVLGDITFSEAENNIYDE